MAVAGVGLVALVAFGALHWFVVPIALGAAAALAFGVSRVPLLAGAVVLAALVVADASPIPGPYHQLAADRSFFGVNRVLASADGTQHVLLNGTVVHGAQLVGEPRAPVSYYTREGPLGDVLAATARAERVGVVGLGAGAIACYGTSRRSITFYEIDPTVIAIARDPSFFRYLSECPPEQIVLGDARITLAGAADASYDVLVVDAYSGDSMPVHLLTREAFALYRRVLAPGGVIALHLSNAYFDLEPLVASLAAGAGLASRVRDDTDSGDPDAALRHPAGWSPSTWALVGSDADIEARVGAVAEWRPLHERTDLRIWTDDYVNLLAVRR
jgi:SAM-dependent methyltransferase